MATRTELRRQVLEALRMEPGLDASSIEVAVQDGQVILTGSVSSYAASCLADRATKRVPGANCVIDELTLATQSDEEIASEPVSSGAESEEAEYVVGSAPGLKEVENAGRADEVEPPRSR